MSKNVVVARRLAKAFVAEAFQLVLDPPACVTLNEEAREQYLTESLCLLRRSLNNQPKAVNQGQPSLA